MAFPASALILDNAYKSVKQYALDIRSNTLSMRNLAAAGTNAQRIIFYSQSLANLRAQMAALVSTPGLAAYAQTQENNPSLNVAAEYTAMNTQIGTTLAWISTNFPKDANGYLLAAQLNPDGTLQWRDFSAASLAGFVTVLDALLATIN